MEISAPSCALVLAPEAPYPIAGGGAIRTASLIEYLAQRHAVDLIVFRQPGDPDPAAALPAGLVRRVTVLTLPAHHRGLAARAWRNAARVAREIPPLVDRFSGFERQVSEAVADRSYAVGLIEHFWCAPYLDAISSVCARTFVDLHNIESVLHARCADVEPPATAFAHRIFRRASLDLERVWLPRFSEVLATSETDAAYVRRFAPQARVRVYPNAIRSAASPPRAAAGPPALVFSGNLEYHPNLSAVRYFRDRVWPALRTEFPDLVWRLVGKNPEAVRPLLAGDPRIEIVGPVTDAVCELARASVAIVPLLAGSGTRFKILEAWAAGLPVVSTTIGAEGLSAVHDRHLLLADSATDFIAAVSRLLACSEVGDRLTLAGRLLLQQEFTWETAWRNLNF